MAGDGICRLKVSPRLGFHQMGVPNNTAKTAEIPHPGNFGGFGGVF
jgi:hypothetical protein